ncbi:hypothetical protein CDAR_409841 [Caerostris darwini]|uniref:Uncharacterized protein n=1 Tax=Caerostris darwini TaxID=1538125 RepID=A0AAV4RH86_9ARAC|nr:hypothetical protein CDAR_409841 [Caerostris darwini]
MHSSFLRPTGSRNRWMQFSPNWQSNGGISRNLFWGTPFAERSGRLASDKAATPTPLRNKKIKKGGRAQASLLIWEVTYELRRTRTESSKGTEFVTGRRKE